MKLLSPGVSVRLNELAKELEVRDPSKALFHLKLLKEIGLVEQDEEKSATGHWAFKYVQKMFEDHITTGCGGGNYCPESPLTRAQMAVFLSTAPYKIWKKGRQ